MMNVLRTLAPVSAVLALSLGVSSCALQSKLNQIGQAPPLTPVAVPGSPISRAIALPAPAVAADAQPSSALWRSGSRSFFNDPRAAKVGDILTINIDIGDAAQIDNSTTQSRSASESAGLGNFFGFEDKLSNFLPNAVDPSSLADFGSDSSNSGTGSVNRSETINLTVAAIVLQVLPNGNLVIQGQQEVRVNFEVRELTVSGIVRPEDISNANTINHTQIAEARISYGGRGHITDVQQPRYGQQFYDIIMPF